jgi:amino acid adenylation domain-containing protein
MHDEGVPDHQPRRLGRLMGIRPRGSALAIAAADPLPGAFPPGCQAYPASFAQARLWFLHQLERGLTAYHLPLLWRLRGDLDIPALTRALSLLVERHPSLRTSFSLQGREVVQIIHPPVEITLPEDVLGDRNAQQVIGQWLYEESHTPFDLTAGLLLRARLLRMDQEEHLLLINHHHIASDGWSCSVLTRDLLFLYDSTRSCSPPRLHPLTACYHDYASWQRRRLSGLFLQELSGYWIQRLEGVKTIVLPCDYRRPPSPSFRGGRLFLQIQPSLLQPFEVLCRSEGSTLQMGLVTLLALLLHRYSNQEDFAIGIPVWGRNDPTYWRRAAGQLVDLIGFFINTLPIRISFLPSQTFRELLQQVKRTSLEAYEHHELPFEQIIDALKLERDTSRNPLIQVMLQLSQLPGAAFKELGGLEVETLPTRTYSAKFDLEFFLRRRNGGLEGSITYATDVFVASRIERLSTHLTTLLASVLQAPDAGADVLDLMPEAECQLIVSWQRGPSTDVTNLCVHELFEQQVERTPEATALVFQEHQLTYAELDARANRLARHLIDLGVGPEVIVAVGLERSIEMVVALLGILKAGGAYLPLDPSWPRERQELLLREAGCMRLLLPCDREQQAGGWDGAILAVNATGEAELLQPATGSDGDGDSEAAERPLPTVSAGRRLAYLTYTSGSTGVPKGVAIEHRSILRLVDPANGFRLGPGAVVLQLAPLAFDAATFEIWGPLLGGGTLVLAPAGMPALGELADLLRRRGITTLWLTAGLFHAMVEEELQALAGVGQVLAGGDVLWPDHVQRLLDAFPPAHELINGYGPTENTTFTCCHRMAAGEMVDPQRVPIGRPIALTEVHVLDPAGHPCPIGIPGELHIGGAGLARGYLHNPGLTAEKFIPDPFSSDPAARLYKSGDRASWNPDGTLAFHGRIDQQIKLRGFRIEPGEIEGHLLAHPAVAQAVVVLQSVDPANPRLVGYWVGEAGATASAEQLRSFLAERLPESMVPTALVELAALPLTSNGKLDRRALPAPSFAGDRERRLEPTTELERQLHGIWAEVLGHGEFGITDNFFAIGGHSLAAARLVSLIDTRLGTTLPIATIFHAPTLSRMARLLQNPTALGEHLDPCLVPLQTVGEATPLFVIHGYGGDVFCYTDFAQHLAPHRPVYGLQARGIEGHAPRHRSVEEMAEHYATLIQDRWPKGPYHLLGQSAGGWYAWAVAAALVQRGGAIGMLAILDSGPTAFISRRLRAVLLAGRTLQRIPTYAYQLLHHKRPRHFLHFMRCRTRNLAVQLKWFGKRAAISPGEGAEWAASGKADYYDLVHRHYRPQPLPVELQLFTTPTASGLKRRLWEAYAGKGVRHRHLFEEHHHYHLAPWAAELGAAVQATLQEVEGGDRERPV